MGNKPTDKSPNKGSNKDSVIEKLREELLLAKLPGHSEGVRAFASYLFSIIGGERDA